MQYNTTHICYNIVYTCAPPARPKKRRGQKSLPFCGHSPNFWVAMNPQQKQISVWGRPHIPRHGHPPSKHSNLNKVKLGDHPDRSWLYTTLAIIKGFWVNGRGAPILGMRHSDKPLGLI